MYMNSKFNFDKLMRFFRRERVFAFTTDLDWAPEWAINELLKFFENAQIPLTPFITHKSALIEARYGVESMQQYVGLHPNFLPNSSHGRHWPEQIAFCQTLWPRAVFFRSHCYYDCTPVCLAMVARGMLFDSNLCLFLQPHITPLGHESGLLRLPVFWADDAHCRYELPGSLKSIAGALELPGLKIFNVHPLNFALNTPSLDYYRSHKFLYEDREGMYWRDCVYRGRGERTLLEELALEIQKREIRCMYLYDLYCNLPGRVT